MQTSALAFTALFKLLQKYGGIAVERIVFAKVSMKHDAKGVVMLFLSLCFIIGSQPAFADDSKAEIAEHFQRNAKFLNKTTTAKVTRRFEMYDPHSVEQLRDLKEMGFTQVILDWPNLHSDATKLGLDVVLANWWTDQTPKAEIDAAIDFAKTVDRKHLVGISMMDEPNRNSPQTPFGYYIDEYERLRPQLATELPELRLEISHWGPMGTWDRHRNDYFSDLYEAADLIRIMPYPDLHEQPLSDVYFMMQRSRKLMRQVNRDLPLLVILQAWILPPKNKLPEIDELRVMSYQAILGGAETLSFFEYNLEAWKQTPGFREEFKKMMQELTQFSNEHADSKVDSSMNSSGIFHANIVHPTGRTTRVLINTNRFAVEQLDALQIEFAFCGTEE